MRLEPMPADAAGLARALARRSNDLTAPAVALVPQIAAVLRAIADMPDCLLSRMSGSGATCFGLFADAAAAAAAAAKIVRIHADWWIASGRLLSDAHAPTGV
jgi:4-diphosphocytidyl-2-C-methyl-D-erythritol kinase